MRIEVTQENIDKGKMGKQWCCPVALALNDAGYLRAWVTSRVVELDEDGPIVHLPSDVMKFISTFDHRKPVEPFTFDLEIPAT